MNHTVTSQVPGDYRAENADLLELEIIKKRDITIMQTGRLPPSKTRDDWCLYQVRSDIPTINVHLAATSRTHFCENKALARSPLKLEGFV